MPEVVGTFFSTELRHDREDCSVETGPSLLGMARVARSPPFRPPEDPPPEDPLPEDRSRRPGDAPVVELDPLLPALDPPDPAGLAGLADLPEDAPLEFCPEVELRDLMLVDVLDPKRVSLRSVFRLAPGGVLLNACVYRKFAVLRQQTRRYPTAGCRSPSFGLDTSHSLWNSDGVKALMMLRPLPLLEGHMRDRSRMSVAVATILLALSSSPLRVWAESESAQSTAPTSKFQGRV